ncbi:MAG TPA: arsenic transporter [Candidatus Binataceae bacterium]|nr:arsenic transporter [Candidatus Binataceae bacterium]
MAWAIGAIAIAACAGVVVRPFAWPEYIWAVVAALLLVVLRLLPLGDALIGIAKGTDVYLFLTGMMLLAELARHEGLFDWLAAQAARHADGSATRLFTLIFLVGTVVTIFLSNDATAVVLTPAVAAVVKTGEAAEPLPYLFICAFIANAASFVLPISNPANLVLYSSRMPPLLQWLSLYELPSLASILATYIILRWTQRKSLQHRIASDGEAPELSRGGKFAAIGIAGTAAVLAICSAFDLQLGLPTFIAGVVTVMMILPTSKQSLRVMLTDIQWNVLPLVAGLFVLVEGIEKTGATTWCAAMLHHLMMRSAMLASWASGIGLALICNLTNNLPAGLIAPHILDIAKVSERFRAVALIAVDLGPNLSVTGSLATILWLTALRRDGQKMDAWTFLKLGALVMPPALIASLAAALFLGPR